MKFPVYNHREIEPEILKYWKKNKILENIRKRNKQGKKFYFLEGPPYTSGRVHLGTAWNMALKDIVLRYKRMQKLNVWDRMGYDMHGLPTEQKVMAKLNLEDKQAIKKFGLKKFTNECEKFCIEMMKNMNEDFIRLGATLDFSNPYQPISKGFMEAQWWLIKQAHKKDRLYQGLRTMHWDAATASSVAKHELEYKQVTDTSIYVKFKTKDKSFIIWTTTPWTIPLNLAIMVNPELDYQDVQVGKEVWVVAKSLVKSVMQKAEVEDFRILKTYKGKKLENQSYSHPLQIKEHLPKELQNNKQLFTVLLSTEFVDDSAGTGLVHCAPGCGPEDYEVGHKNGIPPFNCVNEKGLFTDFGEFTNMRAKLDDKQFVDAIHKKNALIAKEPYVHDYPHGERSHQPVIFRTTKQWFFKVEDLKDKMLRFNENIYWNPQSSKNAFKSWLENLRDNSITKQRYWGTAVPIWQANEDDFIVIESVKELEKLSGQKVTNLHIPDIDKITIKKNNKTYKRIPDVLDVWIDAGTVSWNCLDYPQTKENFEKFFPADFILEGKDQIRGWFNLLMVASTLALDKPSFKNVYMHGFLNDVGGVKMSKSLGNIIAPDELIQKHGADVLRYYMGETNAGEDINFSWDECAVKSRQLNILWNIHKLLLNLAKESNVNPFKLNKSKNEKNMSIEEHYIISKLHSTIKYVTQLLEEYKIDKIITPLEDLFLELSRTYVQMVRDKSSIGDKEEKEVVIFTITHVFFEFLTMFSIVAPFVCEAMYLNFKKAFNLKDESISYLPWPKADAKKINSKLEKQMQIAQNIIQGALSAREKAKLGLRWPIKEITVTSANKELISGVKNLGKLILQQTNAKKINIQTKLTGTKATIIPQNGKIGATFKALAPKILLKIKQEKPEVIIKQFESKGVYMINIEKEKIKITPEMILIERQIPNNYTEASCKNSFVYVNTQRDEKLETEGYVRELIRNIQNARKKAGLEKLQQIDLFVQTKMKEKIKHYLAEIGKRVGAARLEIASSAPKKKYQFEGKIAVKKEEFLVWFSKV